MYVVFQNVGHNDNCVTSAYCKSPHAVPGKEVDVATGYRDSDNCRTSVNVSPNHPILYDACKGYTNIKEVDPQCKFYILSNEQQVNDVKPYIKELMERKIFTLKESSRADLTSRLSSIRADLKKTFLNSDGKLINSSFSRPNLTPDDFANAGFKFIGHETHDIVACHFHPDRHRFHEFEDDDTPLALYKHKIPYFFRCNPCMMGKEFTIPALHTAANASQESDVTGKTFTFVMPEDEVEYVEGHGLFGPTRQRKNPFGTYCDKTALVINKDLELPCLDFKEFQQQVNLAKQDKISNTLEKLISSKPFDANEASKLFSDLIVAKYFSSSQQELDDANGVLIDTLDTLKSQLQAKDSDIKKEIENIIHGLKTNIETKYVENFIKPFVDKQFLIKYSHLLIVDYGRGDFVTAAHEAMLRTVDKDIEKRTVNNECRLNDYLDWLLKKNNLGNLLSKPELSSNPDTKRACAASVQMGIHLTGILDKISTKLNEFIKQ